MCRSKDGTALGDRTWELTDDSERLGMIVHGSPGGSDDEGARLAVSLNQEEMVLVPRFRIRKDGGEAYDHPAEAVYRIEHHH